MNGTLSRRRRHAGIWAVAALFALLAACGDPIPPAVEAPEITSFTASPNSISVDSDITLSWAIAGSATVTMTANSNPVVIPGGASQVVVRQTADADVTYTLTAANAAGSDSESRTVTINDGTTTLSDTRGSVVAGSQIELEWTATNAASIDVYAVDNDDANDADLVTSLAGDVQTLITPIPVAARQNLRVCARASDPADDVCETVDLPSTIVISAVDYDPYDIGGFTSETPVAGSLRAVVATAAANSVIGFAADVTTIDLYGVALYPPGTGNVDAHLIVDKNLTISGPASGVTLTGVSGYQPGTDPDDGAGGFTYRSRMLYVIPAVTVELENLTLTGGTFIYKGGGIHNAGDLTGRNLTVTGNRAWDVGGGIYNNTGAILTLEDSLISDNRAVTEVDEVGVAFDIRGGFTICMIRSGYGGGIYNEEGGTVTLIDTVVSGNEAKISGGGIYNYPGGSVTITGGSVTDNVANHFTYTNDAAYPDPPLFSDPADGCPEDTSAFEPYSIGGGIYNGGTLEMSSGSILTNDVHNAGGGLFIDHESEMATLTNVLVQGNLAGIDNTSGFGGGIQHEFFAADGPESNYTPTGVTYGSGNLPDDILQNPIAAAPTAIGPSSLTAPLPGRYVPNPNVRDR